MSFDKEYPNRKDHRKQYYGSKAIDHTCRSHGSCSWCENNRKFKTVKLGEVRDAIANYYVEKIEEECEVLYATG